MGDCLELSSPLLVPALSVLLRVPPPPLLKLCIIAIPN